MQTEKKELQPTPDLEALIKKKEPRLPKSVRIYIRRLKENGQLEKALQVRESFVESRRQATSREEKVEQSLVAVNVELLTTNNLKIEAVRSAESLWWLRASGEITGEEMRQELNKFLDGLEPNTQDYVESMLPEIRDKVTPFILRS